jgi:regulator of sirC expression with transglutaminase-like and TPR domain
LLCGDFGVNWGFKNFFLKCKIKLVIQNKRVILKENSNRDKSPSIMLRFSTIILLFFIVFSTDSFSQKKFPENYTPLRTYSGQAIWDVAKVKEENIDIGLWALVISKEYDSSVDVQKYLKTLDGMAIEIKRMVAGRTSDMDKLLAVRMFLYESGKWNNFKPFSYDLDDPFGDTLSNKLLSTYIDKRKGNCISMPTLFLALMERVDPNVQLRGSLAPQHFMCRFTDRQTGDAMIIEPANGGHPARNAYYIEGYEISKKAVKNKLYLQDLTKREVISELINVLVRKEDRVKRNSEKGLKLAELLLKIAPKHWAALFSKGIALEGVAYNLHWNAKDAGREMTEEEKKTALEHKKKAFKIFETVENLGWRPESKEHREKYLKEIEAEKQKKKQQTLNKK